MLSLILASSSKYRQAQLAALGLHCPAIAPDIDEQPFADESAEAVARRLACAKATTVGQRYPQALTLGSDQVAVVMVDGQARQLGKPGTEARGCEQLTLCSGNIVTFYSALSIYDGATGQAITDTDITRVHFRHLTDAAIAAYIKAEQPLDCAGSFKVEGRGALLFERIESRDPNSLIGLPVMLLRDMLAHHNIDLLALATAQPASK